MGCISSKNARPDSPDLYGVVSTSKAKRIPLSFSYSSFLPAQSPLEKITEEEDEEKHVISLNSGHSGNLKSLRRGSSRRRAGFSFKLGRLTEGELVAAGWPAWLSSVAGEAIDGWLPLRADLFERLDKIGQGTYSDVYRARELETGRFVAVKKVRFDNFHPESVRFMAREITILRRLNHPNVMKLEGIITSRFSSHIYLVFEYMEHDLAGLLASPNIRFTEAQIKCYMRQILSGVEHCHSRGVVHRDIKTSNILVNNEGILKIGDFGLANFMRPKNKQPMTSRVVTLWYRPPELLLGATEYGEAVDLWSVGCVFAELFIGRPILKGRTEVEQLHKIFRLCGSPPDEYWKKSKLPLANMFKPQYPYESTLRERCKELPKSAVSLLETFLSFEPYKRGSASSALNFKYFHTKPYACDPASLPQYAPSKEFDAKLRDDLRRRRSGHTAQPHGGTRSSRRVQKPLQESTDASKVIPAEVGDGNNKRSQGESSNVYSKRRMASTTTSQGSNMSNSYTGQKATASSSSSSKSRHYIPLEQPPKLLQADDIAAVDMDDLENNDSSDRTCTTTTTNKDAKPDIGDSSNLYAPHEPYMDADNKKKKSQVAFSGPVIYHYEEVSYNDKDHPVQQVRQRSRFYQDS
ncbi:cyclin-dependent kinase C-2 C-like isoform X2 [Andrographis paniculata]|uniref:cyclin-dependent kinase C-2 C-like isoform X2 n=1 Tax=Andrographis paniculata TaxID=175694 RepID=UPI0021E70B1A|nr:cyclin-dependent kinase C-2 C-like isoform X2 [Andrographis paniculata]